MLLIVKVIIIGLVVIGLFMLLIKAILFQIGGSNVRYNSPARTTRKRKLPDFKGHIPPPKKKEWKPDIKNTMVTKISIKRITWKGITYDLPDRLRCLNGNNIACPPYVKAKQVNGDGKICRIPVSVIMIALEGGHDSEILKIS